MISFSQLGNFGRLGNQLFQAACTISFARRHGMDYALPKWEHANAFKGKFIQFDLIPDLPRYKEPDFHYSEIPKMKDVDLVGYFQSEKYFKDNEKEIRELFQPSDEISVRIKKEYGDILNGNTCAIHIRRGDYVRLSNYHTNLSMHYYKSAVSKIKADKYLVFSDDIEWCKDKIYGTNIIYIDSGSDALDFFVMSQCKNFIIANSSFSWWASYLCQNSQKRIIAPRKTQWFSVDSRNKIVDDLYLSNWESTTKSAVIIFHKNADRYPDEWIYKCISSIRNQTYKEFDVFELDYGGSGNRIYAGSNFINKELKDHAEAHNYLLDLVFEKGYDCAFNVNLDDVYAPTRFERQLEYIEKGYDVVSSNFYNINEEGHVTRQMEMHKKNMILESERNLNIIAHPVLCYSRNFWTTCTRLRSEEIPRDDFELWKRSYASGKYKFVILPDYLLHYRIHDKKVSAKK